MMEIDDATENDECYEGVCAGRCTGVVCTPDQDACQAGGICNSEDGTCSFDNAADGTTCDDEDDATDPDVCDGDGVCAGACIGVDCTPGQCQDEDSGVCDSSTGACVFTNKPEDTRCNDDNDVCFEGVCAGRCTGVVCIPDPRCLPGRRNL